MAQLPSSPTKIFDHPIIGIDQQQQIKVVNFEKASSHKQVDDVKATQTDTDLEAQKAPHAPGQATKNFIHLLKTQKTNPA